MANSPQAKKRARQGENRRQHNASMRSSMRTAVKKFDAAIVSGEKEAIATSFKTAMSELHSAASKGIIKKETASRKVSRMAAQIRKTA